jgi:uncharacterized protein with HEPN domain
LTEPRHYILFLEDIRLSMQRINEYISKHDFGSFKKDYKTVDAVIRNFEIIGEATKSLPKEIQAKYPDTPWSEMYRLRNRITHEYFGVDYRIIWRISKEYLPENLRLIEKIIKLEKAKARGNK